METRPTPPVTSRVDGFVHTVRSNHVTDQKNFDSSFGGGSMGSELTVEAERPHVAHLTFEFGKANLLTRERLNQLRNQLRSVPDDVSVLTVGPVHADEELTGLCGGLHLGAVKDMSVSEAREVLDLLHETLRTVRNLDAVTVCDCGTYALGAGLELALACDFRIATQDAILGLPEIDVGLVTGIEGGLLVRLVGLQRAKELIYLGEPVDGLKAVEDGFINRATIPDEHRAAVTETVDRLAEKSPTIMQLQKEVFKQWRSNGLESGMDHSLELIATCFDTDDQREAMEAFLQRT